MTYKELIENYPCVDAFLELFKGIAPTLVALLAIIINNLKANNRDKKSRSDMLMYNVKKEMFDKFIDLSRLQWKSGADLIDYLSETEEENRENYYDCFRNSLYDSLYKAQEILDYYYAVFQAFDIDIDCKDVVDVSRKYSDKLNDLHEEYCNTYKIAFYKKRNAELDILRDKVLIVTDDVKNWTNEIMGQIADSLSNQIA